MKKKGLTTEQTVMDALNCILGDVTSLNTELSKGAIVDVESARETCNLVQLKIQSLKLILMGKGWQDYKGPGATLVVTVSD